MLLVPLHASVADDSSFVGVQETKIKGYVNILGYKVTVDENVNPGRYGFRIEHDHDKTHYFSSDEKSAIRDWMKAIMKATIGRDYTSMPCSLSFYTPAPTFTFRACHLILQCTHYPFNGGTGDEPGT